MNLVLADTEEFRRVKRKAGKSTAPGASSTSAPLVEAEEKRTLGLTIVRGAHIISLSVESPPPADPSARLGTSAPGGVPSAMAAGAGIARPAGRGAAIGLAVCDTYLCLCGLVLILHRALLLVLVLPHLDTEASQELHLLLDEEVSFHENLQMNHLANPGLSTRRIPTRRIPTSRRTIPSCRLQRPSRICSRKKIDYG